MVVGGGWWVVVLGRGSVFVPVFAPPVFVVVPLFFAFAPHVLYMLVCFAGLCIGGATGRDREAVRRASTRKDWGQKLICSGANCCTKPKPQHCI